MKIVMLLSGYILPYKFNKQTAKSEEVVSNKIVKSLIYGFLVSTNSIETN